MTSAFEFPQWGAAYRDVLEENDLPQLLRKMNAAETAIFHRLQELQIAASAGDEKRAIQEALKVLLAVKTEKLNFPGIVPGVKPSAEPAALQPNSTFARHTVHDGPGTDA
jgi:hypothetical protein